MCAKVVEGEKAGRAQQTIYNVCFLGDIKVNRAVGDLDGAADRRWSSTSSLTIHWSGSSKNVAAMYALFSSIWTLPSVVLAHSRSSINICGVNKVATIVGSGENIEVF